MMKKLINMIPVWSLSALATLIVAYLSLAPNPPSTDVVSSDKVAHAIAYFVLTVVFTIDYIRSRLPHHTRFDVELAFAAAAATLGGVLEICQLIMNIGRHYEWQDWVADIIGAVIGYLFMKLWFTRKTRHYLLRHRKHRHHHHHHHHHDGEAA